MKRRRTLAVAAGAIGLLLALGIFWRQGVGYHTRSWQRAAHLATGAQIPWWDRISGALLSKNPAFWWDQVKHHEAELLKLGYLTNCQFRLTNQVMTREFSSNFFYQINLRLGTNTDQVWRCPYLTNDTGIEPTMPAKDHAIWEQTFRECAALYASNLLPATVTADSPQAH